MDSLRVGQLALALGRPGQSVQASAGIVSAVGGRWQTATGGLIDAYFQADLVMYPGFSGGPLAVAGETGFAVAGVMTSALMHGMNMAIPTSTVTRVVEALLAHGHIPARLLGCGASARSSGAGVAGGSGPGIGRHGHVAGGRWPGC